MEIIKTIFDFTMIAGIFLGLIFVLITQISKKRNDKTVIYLNCVIFFITINNLQIFLVDNNLVTVNFFARKMLIPWYLLILPSFYVFIIHYLKIEHKINSFFKYFISLFLLEITIRIVLFPNYYNEKDNYTIARYSQFEEIANALFAILIYLKAFLLLFKYSKLYKYVLSFDNIKWLKNFMFLGSFVILMWVCAIVLNINEVINPKIFIYYPMRFCCSVLLYWIGYQGFFNYSLMTERIQLRKIITTDHKTKLPLVKNEITKEDRFQLIKEYVETNKRYLDSNFSLENLSSEMKMSVSSLSQIINLKKNYGFADYINSLRVEEAKKYLRESLKTTNPNTNQFC